MDRIRAAVALAWAVVCAAALALLICAPWVVMALTPNPPTWLDAVTLGKLLLLPAGVGLVWTVFRVLDEARPERDPSDIDLTREEQPHLYALVDAVARQVGVTPPGRVTLSSGGDVVLRWRSGPELVLGLAALHVLDADDLRAVIAHELAFLRYGRFDVRVLAWRLHRACLHQRQRSGQVAAWTLLPYMGIARPVAGGVARTLDIAADQMAAHVTSPTIAARAWRRLAAAQVAGHYVETSLASMFDYAGLSARLSEAVRAVVLAPLPIRRPFLAAVAEQIATDGTNPWDSRLPLRARLAAWDAGEDAAREVREDAARDAGQGSATLSAAAPQRGDDLLAVTPAEHPAATVLVGDVLAAEQLQLHHVWPVGPWAEVVRRGARGAVASWAHFHLVTLLNDRVLRADTVADVLRVIRKNQVGRLVDEWYDMGVRRDDGAEAAAPQARAFDDDDSVTLDDAVAVAHTIIAAVALSEDAGEPWWDGQLYTDVRGVGGQTLFALVEGAVMQPDGVDVLAETLQQWGLDLDAPILPLVEAVALETAPRLAGVVTGMTAAGGDAVDVYVWNHGVVAVPAGVQREVYVGALVDRQRVARQARKVAFGGDVPTQDGPQVHWEDMLAEPQATVVPFGQVAAGRIGWLRQFYLLRLGDGSVVDFRSTAHSHDYGEPTLALSEALAGRVR